MQTCSLSGAAGEGRSHPRRIYIVAEMACSHEGDPDLARGIIDAAGAAGADGIQFQIWSRHAIMAPQHPDFEKLAQIELSRSQWSELADYARDKCSQMEIIACVYEPGSVDFVETLNVEAYKLHTADLSNPHLVKHVAATGKRVDLSIGASTLDEIQTAIEWIHQMSNSHIWLMYGMQNFPTRTDEIRLDYMMKLKELFELPLGYQDHTDAELADAFYLPAAALGMGADVLEKHITHDRAKKGVDHEAALNPDEFARFVEMVRTIEAARGQATPRPFTDEELKYRKYSKKSLVAGRDIPAGAVLQDNDLTFMRAEELGLPPDQSHRLVGRTAKSDIAKYQLVRLEDVS